VKPIHVKPIHVTKRAFDFLIALAALLVLAPVLVGIAAAGCGGCARVLPGAHPRLPPEQLPAAPGTEGRVRRSIWIIGVPAVMIHALVDDPFARFGVSAWTFLVIGMRELDRESH
jgi:hypothetical protein